MHYCCIISEWKCLCTINNNIRQHNFLLLLHLACLLVFNVWLRISHLANSSFSHVEKRKLLSIRNIVRLNIISILFCFVCKENSFQFHFSHFRYSRWIEKVFFKRRIREKNTVISNETVEIRIWKCRRLRINKEMTKNAPNPPNSLPRKWKCFGNTKYAQKNK